VGSGGQKLVLRVHRAGYHDRTEILSELDWIAALHDSGTVTTAVPIARLDGERLSAVELDGQRHWVSAFSFLEGEEPKVGHHLAYRFEELGMINARLHQHAKGWAGPDGFVRKRWDFDLMFGARPIWGDWRAAYDQSKDIALLEGLEKHLRSSLDDYGDGPERFGLIHGDLRVANLLDDGNRLAVIDFDDCGFSWFAYDFAAAISFHEEDEAVPTLQDAWLKGYRTVAPFDDEDEAILPSMIMARRLLLTAWLASRAGNDTDALYGRGFAEGTVRLARAYLG
jgi:Ser/Thr protein kinase RdoA (MazF antagonist)